MRPFVLTRAVLIIWSYTLFPLSFTHYPHGIGDRKRWIQRLPSVLERSIRIKVRNFSFLSKCSSTLYPSFSATRLPRNRRPGAMDPVTRTQSRSHHDRGVWCPGRVSRTRPSFVHTPLISSAKVYEWCRSPNFEETHQLVVDCPFELPGLSSQFCPPNS